MNIKSIIKAGAVFTAGALFALHFMAPVVDVPAPDPDDDEECRKCEDTLLEMLRQVSDGAAERSPSEKQDTDCDSDAPTYLFAACEGKRHYADWTAVVRDGVIGYRVTFKNENDIGQSIMTIQTEIDVNIPDGIAGKPVYIVEVQALYKNGSLGAPRAVKIYHSEEKPAKAE